MHTVLEIRQMKPEKITIRCRNKTNWARIMILTLLSVLISWLAYGITCAVIEQDATFWQALCSPVALVFLAVETVAWFFIHLKKGTEST